MTCSASPLNHDTVVSNIKSNMATSNQDGNQGMERFELLEQSIEQFIETTRQIGIIVSDVQPGSQGVLNQKM